MRPSTPTEQFIFFWKVGERPYGCMSQWFPSPFTDERGIHYSTAEQYMMYQKAVLFGDAEVGQRILGSRIPHNIKSLGRLVKGFDEEIWQQNRLEIVIRGNILKFGQNMNLKRVKGGLTPFPPPPLMCLTIPVCDV